MQVLTQLDIPAYIRYPSKASEALQNTFNNGLPTYSKDVSQSICLDCLLKNGQEVVLNQLTCDKCGGKYVK